MTAEYIAFVLGIVVIACFLVWVGRPITRASPRKEHEPTQVDRNGLDRECGLSKELAELDRLRAIQHQPDLFFLAVSKAAVRDDANRCFILTDSAINTFEWDGLKAVICVPVDEWADRMPTGGDHKPHRVRMASLLYGREEKTFGTKTDAGNIADAVLLARWVLLNKVRRAVA